MLKTILFIALGGGIGSVFRYLTYILVQKYYASFFPIATFITNAIGCLLIGIFVGLLEKHELANLFKLEEDEFVIKCVDNGTILY